MKQIQAFSSSVAVVDSKASQVLSTFLLQQSGRFLHQVSRDKMILDTLLFDKRAFVAKL